MNRHIILTSGRSGSNYLANLLNQHPHIVNYGEILAKVIIPYKFFHKCKNCKLCPCPWTVHNYLNGFYNTKSFFYVAQFYSVYAHLRSKKPINFKMRHKLKSIGTKDFFLNLRVTGAEDYFATNKDIIIIHLYRENILRRYLSNLSMQVTGIVHTEKSLEVPKLTVDIAHMLTHLDVISKEVADENRILNRLKEHQRISIKYEDFFADEKLTQSYVQQIFELLGVEPLQIKSKQKKILPQDMRELVSNYNEFCERLHNTQYQQYLD